MKLNRLLWAFVWLVWAGDLAGAQEPPSQLIPPTGNPGELANVQAPGKQGEPAGPAVPPQEPPAADAFAQAPAADREAPTDFNPRMIGDFSGFFGLRTITVPSSQTITQFQTFQQVFIQNGVVRTITIKGPVSTVQVPVAVTTVTRVPLGPFGAFKVAENQSPMPEDRVFFTYNYFNNLHGSTGSFANQSTNTQQTTLNGLTTITSTVIPGVPPPRLDLHGEVIGFEKSILDGRASVGVRVPFFQQQGDGSFSQNDFGDLGFLFNYAFFQDRTSGNVVSGGLLVTAPTGPAVDTPAGNIHTAWLQPFAGYYWNFDRFYLLGFSSVAVPTDTRQLTCLFNDIGIGYWLYRGNPDRILSAVVPTIEVHVTTPLNHRQDPLGAFDEVTLTAGVHFALTGRSLLTLGLVTPVSGPRPFNVEAALQFNYRF